MKVYCKKTYHTHHEFLENTWYDAEIEQRNSNLYKGEIVKIYGENSYSLYFVFKKDLNRLILLSVDWKKYVFEDYFYTEKELRQLKLKQLNEKNIL